MDFTSTKKTADKSKGKKYKPLSSSGVRAGPSAEPWMSSWGSPLGNYRARLGLSVLESSHDPHKESFKMASFLPVPASLVVAVL